MIKGARKQLIVVRTGGSRYFDGAYFVLKEDPGRAGHRREDILREANRILEENSFFPRKRRHGRLVGWLFFLVGILCGGGAALLLGLLFF